MQLTTVHYCPKCKELRVNDKEVFWGAAGSRRGWCCKKCSRFLTDTRVTIKDFNNYSSEEKEALSTKYEKQASVNNITMKVLIGVIIISFAFIAIFAGGTGSSSGHRCAICGKTEGTRQITAKTSSGQFDDNWYCSEHYADAWQYYYGDH